MTDHNLDIEELKTWLQENLTGFEEFDNGGKFWTDCMPSAHMDIEGFLKALHQYIINKVIEALEELNTGAVGTNCCSTHIQLVNKLSELKQQANPAKEEENYE